MFSHSHVVTHLICSSPVGKKYLYALSTQRSEPQGSQPPQVSSASLSHPIHIVNELWILDCIRFQRRVEESHYLPLWLREGNYLEDGVESSADVEEVHETSLTSPHPSKINSKKDKQAGTSTKALKALLNRVQGSSDIGKKRSLEFRYGDDSDEGNGEDEFESNPNHQQESEVIEEEAMAEEIWNEKKVDYCHHEGEEEEGDDLVSPIKSRQRCMAPVFLLGGGLHVKYRALEQEAKEMIMSLGGTVLPPNSSYNECTHLILWELKRTEKFLCCCVSGKVISRDISPFSYLL
jgi:hypothetical protein